MSCLRQLRPPEAERTIRPYKAGDRQEESMGNPFQSVQGKLLTFALCISIIPIVVITTIYHLNARRTVKKQTLDLLKAVAESRKSHILSFLKEKRERAIDFSSDALIGDSLAAIALGGYRKEDAIMSLNRYLLMSKKPLDPNIVAIAVVNQYGKVVASTNEGIIGMDISPEEVFAEGINKGYREACVGQPHYYPYLDADCIPVSASIASMWGGKTMGVLINTYDMAALNEITTDRTGMGETGEVYLVNKDRIMLTESRFINNAPFTLVVDTKPIQESAEGKEMVGIYPDYRGVPIVGASAYIPEFGWTLLAEIDEAEAFASLRMLGIVALIAGCICATVASGMGIFFALSSARPINKLKEAAERFMHGDFKHRVRITRRDEIGALAESFNTMAETIENDIKEMRQLHSQRMSTVGHLSNGIAHHLNNPLTGIGMCAEILVKKMEEKAEKLKDASMYGELKDHLARIKKASGRCEIVVKDLLSISRISQPPRTATCITLAVEHVLNALVSPSGRPQESKPTPFMTNHVLHVTIPQLESRKIQFVKELSPTIPEVLGSHSQLEEVFMNLVSNAIDAMPEGGTLAVKTEHLANENKVEVTISDTGPAIDKKDLPHLFDPYFILKIRPSARGTGLELALAQLAIQSHGGTVEVDSEEGRGTTFKVKLPVCKEASTEAVGSKQ
ncbi:MAG: sensor histidine kinase [Candidatus Brocadiaceae bacterium]|nr:sensor histidine kinase [Candidatus Brocadiaceae bacterium]